MELDVMKKLIKRYEPGHASFVVMAETGERYYKNETDILFQKKNSEEDEKEKAGNPLRNADNRIPRNFHGLIVNQKAAYAFTDLPLFDIGSQKANKEIAKYLGDEYAKNCMELCVNAANTSVGWVHYWKSENGFEWAVVDSKQVIPIWDSSLKRRLIGTMRVYPLLDEETGENYQIYEYWSDMQCQTFRCRAGDAINEGLQYHYMFMNPEGGEMVAEYNHDFEEVPFIPFFNNNIRTDDLKNIKKLIDVFDKVYSGFINDLDDIQELIFVLSGYGGTDLNEFLSELKKYKTIKLDAEEDHPGLSTLSIEIPIEARNSVLDATRKAIFEQGQGYDPQPEKFGNQSGEALKFMYSLLEMKVGLMETEFRLGFSKLIRAVCRFYNIKCDVITQIWTRTRIKNDTELAQICRDSVGVISQRTIIQNHPFVYNTEDEIMQIKKEEQEAQQDSYGGAFTGENKENEKDEDETKKT